MSAYDTDLSERNRLLQQDVIALRGALERTQQEKAALMLENTAIKFRRVRLADELRRLAREAVE